MVKYFDTSKLGEGYPCNVPAPMIDGGEMSDAGDLSFKAKYKATSRDDLYEYVKLLENNGYVSVSKNTFGENEFVSLCGNGVFIHSYYYPSLGILTVTAENDKGYSFFKDSCESVEPAVFASSVSDRSYYIRLPDNSLAIIDGGWRDEDLDTLDNESLYKGFVKELQCITGNEKVTVSAWFITHPHSDHVNFLEHAHKFGVNEYIEIERIIRNTPPRCEWPKDPWMPDMNYLEYLETVYERWSGAQIIKARSGMRFDLSGVKFDILITTDDFLADRVNAMSIVIMQKYKNRRVLWTGDMADSCGEMVLGLYGDNIACNAVQVSHHGWGGCGSLEFYKTCGAEVQLWTNSEYGFRFADPYQGYGKTEVSTAVYDLPECKRHIFCNGIRMEKLSLDGDMFCDHEQIFKF